MNKKIAAVLILLSLVLFGAVAFQAGSSPVYVIPVRDQIEPGWLLFLERSLEEADGAGAPAIVLDMDTPGGYIDTAQKAKKLLDAFEAPVYVYVNTDALSAGAYLALAADGFFMAPGATIGAAEPVIMGGGEVDEKFLSFWEAEMRGAAERQGKDPRLAEAMVRKDISIEDLVERGELLTLTAGEAEDLEFSDGSANDLEEILEAVGLPEAELVRTSPSFWENLSGWLINPVVATLLLILGFFFLFVEVLTAGFGVGGFLSLICFGLYFGGHFFTGVSGWQAIFLFLLGISSLLVEAFVPGFGIFGVGGLVAVFVAIVLAAASTALGFYMLFISFFISAGAGYAAYRYFRRKGLLRSFVLSDAATREAGYSTSDDYSALMGKKGRAVTPLRPSGTVEIEGKRFDTVSEGVYIYADETVEVVRVEGGRIVVRPVK